MFVLKYSKFREKKGKLVPQKNRKLSFKYKKYKEYFNFYILLIVNFFYSISREFYIKKLHVTVTIIHI